MWMIIQYPLKSMKVLMSPSSGHKTLGTINSSQLVDVIVQRTGYMRIRSTALQAGLGLAQEHDRIFIFNEWKNYSFPVTC